MPNLKKIVPRAGVIATVAILLYFVQGFLLIAQKPGLQYDEALLVASAVHMEHSAKVFNLEANPDAWVCPFGRCIPLMSALYVGPIKAYASLPFFSLIGPRTPVIRLVSLLLGVLGIWGVYRLMMPWFGKMTAAISALVLAMNPTFVNMVVFDNNAIAALMAGIGVTFAGVAFYSTRKNMAAALTLGVAMGFGVWCRANFVWLLVAGVFAALIAFRRRVFIPASHAAAIALGGILGGFPFLLYQILSGGATWKAQSIFTVSQSMTALLRERLFLFADMLLFDGESRAIWAGAPLPVWQLWFFACLVLAACLICLRAPRLDDGSRQSFSCFLALTFLFAAAFLFFSRLQIAEHHLVMLLPLAVAIVVAACALLQRRRASFQLLAGLLFIVYGCSTTYWQVQAIRGLRHSGGVGVWSNSGVDLARLVDRNFAGRDIKLLDWGFEYNLYDLANGRPQVREVYAASSENASYAGNPWTQEIRDGGVFILDGPGMRTFLKPSAGFLRVLAATRPLIDRHTVRQHNGSLYAQVLDITPNSIRGPAASGSSQEAHILIGDARFADHLSGFYPPDQGGFRWTKRGFSVTLPLLTAAASGSSLVITVYVPELVIQKLGSLTLRTSFGGKALEPETLTRPGQQVFRRDLNDAWLDSGPVKIDFSLDKAFPPTASDKRELGIVLQEVAVQPE